MKNRKDRREELLESFENMIAKDAAFGAVARLGEFLVTARDVERAEAEGIVRQSFTAARAEATLTGALHVQRRSRRILSVGSRFTWDELVLILTYRLQLDQVLTILRIWSMDIEAFELDVLDEEIRVVALSATNKRRFLSAMATIRRNWAIPIVDKWST